MSQPADPAVQIFAGLVREVTGNVVPSERFALLAELLARRSRALGLPDEAAYLRALASGRLDAEWPALIPAITIKESYFFRAPQQFEVLRRDLLPALLRQRGEARSLRIWCAACARGEEPATLALLFAEEPSLSGWQWRILATDVDPEALDGARRGLYGERAVAQVPGDLLSRYFTPRHKLFELAAGIRERIDYRPLNLAHPPYDLPEEEFDLILLRNVLIYFRRPLQRQVVGQIAARLAPGGALFLGASETLWQIQDGGGKRSPAGELEAVDLGACFCYRHPAAAKAPRAVLPPCPKPAERAARPPVPTVAPVAKPAPAAPRPLAPAKPAMPAMRAMPETSSPEVPAVEQAARLLADNRVEAASAAAAAALAADPTDSAAHVLSGFLHDLAGRAEEAVPAYRAALYLEPGLFQPRLLLADCLLRLGHKELAEKQFQEVLNLVMSGREKRLAALAALPLPDRERSLRRCRQALKRS